MLVVISALIIALPALSFVVNAFVGKRLGEKSGWVAVASIGGSMVLSLYLLSRVALNGGKAVLHSTFTWAVVGDRVLNFGLYIDGLSTSVLVMVGIVATMVITYAVGYMHGDERFSWFFAVISLFTMSMLGLVTSSNLLGLLVFWELMGLCSYLLIGFWFQREEARIASMKAFITTRIGDMGFLAGVMLLFIKFGTLDLPTLFKAVEGADQGFLTLATLLLFWGAVGKSAQFPLHVWLPDAMAGPTPVSGLLHSATMVAAGVFLVARTYPIFEAAHGSLPIVAVIGMFSAIFAACLALTETDIKRTLAYSTMSQLGYMMGALGVGGYVAAVFHLITHGFFKSLLFLSAGSVIHGSGTQDVREMGGLFKSMKTTGITFLIGALALSGIPPLAGFFSKDEILLSLWHFEELGPVGSKVLFVVGVMTAMLTAFYMFRVYFAVFTGPEKGHAHESPKAMIVPQGVLSAATTVAGAINLPVGFAALGYLIAPGHHETPIWSLMFMSAAVATAGIYLAWEQQRSRIAVLDTVQQFATVTKNRHYLEQVYGAVFIKPVFALSEVLRRFNIDKAGETLIVNPVLRVSDLLRRADIDLFYNLVFVKSMIALSEVFRLVDVYIIDGAVNYMGLLGAKAAATFGIFDVKGVDGTVNAVGGVTYVLGRTFRKLQTGIVANYALFMLLFGVTIFYVTRWLLR
ncbi:MAG: NADH-quinone oxidoreductase subunit L [Candidatus Aquicultorales bacterium]